MSMLGSGETDYAIAVKLEDGLVPFDNLPPALNQPTAPCYQNGVVSNEDFLPMFPGKAAKSTFPPGCSVMACCYNRTAAASKEPSSNALAVSQVLRGKVIRAGINLADGGNRETLYQVEISSLDKTAITTIIRPAHDLQFAFGSPVWLWNDNTEQFRPGVVVGSEHFPVYTNDHELSRYVLYSVQLVVGNCKVYHGILFDKLIYRASEVPPGQTAAEQPSVLSMTAKQSPFTSASFATPAATATVSPSTSVATPTTLPVAPLGLRVQVDGRDDERTTVDDKKSMAGEDGALEASLQKLPVETPPLPSSRPIPVSDPEGKNLDANSLSTFSTITSKATQFASPNPAKRSLLSELSDAAISSTVKDHPMGLRCKRDTEDLDSSLASVNNDTVMVEDPEEKKARSSLTVASCKSSNEPYVDRDAAIRKSSIPKSLKDYSKTIGQKQLATSSHRPGSNVSPLRHAEEAGSPNKHPTIRSKLGVRVVNSDPSPFRDIVVGADHHFNKVIGELETLTQNNHPGGTSRWWDVREIVCHRRCLSFHLNGRCWSDCKRKQDHVRLNPKMASSLEDALRPWMHPAGPIVCHPVTSQNEGSATMNQELGNKRTRLEADVQMHTVGPLRKRGKFQLVIKPTDHNSSCASSFVHIKMKVPAFFGTDFLVKSIMGKGGSSGKQLCDMFDCIIELELPASGSSGTIGTLTISGSSRQSLWKCQFAIEYALFRAVPPELREFMLYDLGFFNSYRTKNGKTVLTINPDATAGTETLQHLTIVRCGDFIQDMLVEETDESTFQNTFRDQHPYCQTKLVKEQKDWPRVRPHIAVCGSNLEAVQKCRKSVLEWMQKGASHAMPGPSPGNLDDFIKSQSNNSCDKMSLCFLCDELVSENNMKSHVDLECPKRHVECPLCEYSFISKDLHCHLKSYCPERLVHCALCCEPVAARTLVKGSCGNEICGACA